MAETLLLRVVTDFTQSVKDVKQFEDVLNRVPTSIADVKSQSKQLETILSELPRKGTGEFEKLVQKLAELNQIDYQQAEQQFTDFQSQVTAKIQTANDTVKSFNTSFKQLPDGGNIAKLASNFSKFEKDVEKLPSTFAEVQQRTKNFTKLLTEIPKAGTKGFNELASQLSQVTGQSIVKSGERLRELQKNLRIEVQRGNDAIKEFKKDLKSPVDISAQDGSINSLRKTLISLRKEFDGLSRTDRGSEFGQGLVTQIQSVDSELKDLESQTGRNQRSVGSYKDSIREALAEFGGLDKATQSLRDTRKEQERLNQLGRRLAQALTQGGDAADRMAEKLRKQGVTGKTSQDVIQKELLKTRQAVGVVNNSILTQEKLLKRLNGQFTFLRQAFLGIAQRAGVAVIDGFRRAIGDTIKTFADFQQAAANLASILGKPLEEIQKLRADAERLGSVTRFTASSVVELQTEFAKIGFSETEILAATEATLALAQATGETLAASAEVAGSTVRSFQLDASETGRVTDVMAKSFTSSALNLERFREAMKLVAPISAAANVTLEQTTALMGALADNGLSGSLAGTALKNILSEIGNESSGLSKFLGRTVNNFQELVEAMQDASKRSDNFSRATQTLDKRSRPAVLALVAMAKEAENGSNKIFDLEKAFLASSGAAKRAAEIQDATITGAYKRFQSAIEALQITIVERFNTTIQQALNLASSLTNAISGWLALPVSEEIKNQQVSLNALVIELGHTNEGEERRAEILEIIKKSYPDFLNFIDTEKNLQGQLFIALTKTNEVYAARILIQEQQENLDVASQVAGDKTLALAKQRAIVNERLIKVNMLLGNSVDIVNGSIQQRVDRLAEAIEGDSAFNEQNGTTIFGIQEQQKAWLSLNRTVGEYNRISNRVQDATNEQRQAQEDYNDVLIEQSKNTFDVGLKVKALQIELARLEDRKQASLAIVSGLASEDVETEFDGQIEFIKQQLAELTGEADKTVEDVVTKTTKTTVDSTTKKAKEAAKGSIDALKKELSDLRKDFSATPDNGERLEITESIQDVEAKIKAVEGIVIAFKTRNEESGQIQVRLSNINALESEISQLQERLNGITEEKRIQLSLEIDDIKAKISELTTGANALDGAFESPEVAILERQLARLTDELDNVSEERELELTANISAANQVLQGFKDELSFLEQRNIKLPIIIQDLESTLSNVRDLEDAIAGTQNESERKSLEISLQASQERLEEINTELSELTAKEFQLKLAPVLQGLPTETVAQLLQDFENANFSGLSFLTDVAGLQAATQELASQRDILQETLQAALNGGDEALAQVEIIQGQITDNAIQAERTRLQLALASVMEDSEARTKASQDLLDFEIKQALTASKQRQQIAANEQSVTLEERKRVVLEQLTQITGFDETSKEQRAELERELTRITIEEERKRLQATLDTVEQQIAATRERLKNDQITGTERTNLETRLSGLLVERGGLINSLFEKELQLSQESTATLEVDAQERAERMTELVNTSLDLFGQLFSGITELRGQAIEKELANQKKILSKRYESEQRLFVNNEALKAESKRKLDEENLKLEEAAAKKRKNLARVQAIVETALGVTKALFSGFPIPNVGAGIAAGIAGAIQIGLIEAQEFAAGAMLNKLASAIFVGVPQFATGTQLTASKPTKDGLVNIGGNAIPDTGLIGGRSHSEGGNFAKWNDIPINVERDELTFRNGNEIRYIYTKGVNQNPFLREMAYNLHTEQHNPLVTPIASMVNVLGGGSPFGNYDMTGSFNPVSYSVTPTSLKFQTGGQLATSGGGNELNESVELAAKDSLMQEQLVFEMRMIREELTEQREVLDGILEQGTDTNDKLDSNEDRQNAIG